MNLKQTVSKILGEEVSAKRAQLFANEEFGVLSAYIRNNFVQKALKQRETVKTKKITFINNEYYIVTYK